ncbi:MAG: acetyl-CoA carboxylase biotin carboxyl carrier protein [Spirochaetaceae bacterium]|nr:MAG: acetyl-CoA carboxylase biotin carboxyl carrier protein [Spirochaetaceae bacterium]
MDSQEIFQLIDKFETSSLAELKLNHGDLSLHMRKPGAYQQKIVHAPAGQPMAFQAAAAPVAGPASPESAAAQAAQAAEAKAADDGLEQVTSSIVGTFYRSPSPDSPPHAEVGDVIKAGSPLCIVEAMKVMNELEADYDMEIVAVLAENGSMVEFGTPLFKVRRA